MAEGVRLFVAVFSKSFWISFRFGFFLLPCLIQQCFDIDTSFIFNVSSSWCINRPKLESMGKQREEENCACEPS